MFPHVNTNYSAHCECESFHSSGEHQSFSSVFLNINHSSRVVNTNHPALFCEDQSFHSPSEHQHSSDQTGDTLSVGDYKADQQL